VGRQEGLLHVSVHDGNKHVSPMRHVGELQVGCEPHVGDVPHVFLLSHVSLQVSGQVDWLPHVFVQVR
jgi:hypothetical protein